MARWTSVFFVLALSIACCSTTWGQREVGHVFPVILKDALDPNVKSSEADRPSQQTADEPPAAEKPEVPESSDSKTESKSKLAVKSMLQPILEPQARSIPTNNAYKSPHVRPPSMARMPSPMVPRKIQTNSTGFTLGDTPPTPPSQMQTGVRVANRHFDGRPGGTTMNFRSIEPAMQRPTAPSRPATFRLTDEIPPTLIDRPATRPPSPSTNLTPPAKRPSINFSDDSVSTSTRPGTSILVRPKQDESVNEAVDEAAKIVLQSKIIGPESLTVNQPDEFEVKITNRSDNPANNVIVRLSVPTEITITNLDRDALLDHKSRSVSWKVKQIAPGESEWIRYQAISSTPGSHPQLLTLGMNNMYQGKTPFTTQVQHRTEPATRVAGAESNTRR